MRMPSNVYIATDKTVDRNPAEIDPTRRVDFTLKDGTRVCESCLLRMGLFSASYGFVQEDSAKRRIWYDCVECAVIPVAFSTAARKAGEFWFSSNCLKASSNRCFWFVERFIARTSFCGTASLSRPRQRQRTAHPG